MIPTIRKVMKCYEAIAVAERAKTGRPCEATVQNTLSGTASVCRAGGVPLGATVDRITRKTIDTALATYLSRGVSRLSAWSYVCQMQALFARWCRPYYEDCGWEIPPLNLPAFRAQPPRYARPSPEMIGRVKSWYSTLDGEMWFAATMMLEFAMRNGDVLRLSDDNFVERDGRRFLSYVPHKTELTSGRRVFWPVHPNIWERIDDFGGMRGLDVNSETFVALNRNLRSLGFRGSKAAYELRKICIDHIYQRFGAEMAVSISGDDISTISRYYADPSQPNIGGVRILDLL